MTREELDFIGSMNMCDEISNEAYKKIVCHCEEQEPVLDKIRAEIDKQEKWLLQVGCTACNVDIAFDAIRSVVAESEGKE